MESLVFFFSFDLFGVITKFYVSESGFVFFCSSFCSIVALTVIETLYNVQSLVSLWCFVSQLRNKKCFSIQRK